MSRYFYKGHRQKIGIRISLAVAFILLSIFFIQAQNLNFGPYRLQVMPLFTAAGVECYGFDAVAPRAFRYRTVLINPKILRPAGINPGDIVLISPFGREVYAAMIESVQTDVNGVVSLRGRMEGTTVGYFLLSTAGGYALGSLIIPERNLEYAINYVASRGVHIVQELDPKAKDFLEDGPAPIPSSLGAIEPVPPLMSSLAVAAQSNVDLMIVYTPNAMNWASGQGGINLVIAQAVEKGQLVLNNSSADITLRLVHSALVSYTESGSSSTDLSRLTSTSDGFMDEVHQWRNFYGADIVDIFENVEDTGGIAWLLMSTGGQPNYAFSLVRVKQASWTYTMIHELGHNFGLHHRKDQVTQPGPGIFSYSAGWRWIGNNGSRYCSVMSYQETWDGYSVAQVPYFSSPAILYQGVPAGHAADGDNARTLRQTGPIVSNYRSEQEPEVYYWLAVRAAAGGTTIPVPGKYQYKEGSVVTVTAKPDTHYLFTTWDGDASGSANPINVTMNADKSVTANFLRIIYPPSNAQGEKVLNRSLSQAEYINILTWSANPDNEDIVNYRIYLVEDGQKTLLTTLAADEFECRFRKMNKNWEYTYQIVAVNSTMREGDPAVVVIK
jgi:hypothetical protein